MLRAAGTRTAPTTRSRRWPSTCAPTGCARRRGCSTASAQGQELGDLLGYRFERALHDLGADEHIRAVRQQVLAATGRPDVPPDEPVDGIELLDLDRAGGLSRRSTRAVADALDEIEERVRRGQRRRPVRGRPPARRRQPRAGDGDARRARRGTRAPPELRAPRTPARGRLGRAPGGGPARPGRADARRARLVAPACATRSRRRWRRGWPRCCPTGRPSGSRSAGAADGRSGRATLTLAELGLSALDAIYLVGDDPSTRPGAAAHARRGAARATGRSRSTPTDAGGARLPLAEFAVLAVELRRAVESLRVADARDLRPAHTPGEAGHRRRRGARRGRGADRRVRRGSPTTRRRHPGRTPQRSRRSPSGWPASGISTGAAPADLARGRPRCTRLADAAAAPRSRRCGRPALDRASAAPGAPARRAARRPGAAAGPLPVVGRPTGGDVVDLTAGLADPAEVDDWLDAVGRVRRRRRPADHGRDAERAAHARRRAARRAPARARCCAGRPVGGDAPARSRAAGGLLVVAVTGPAGPPAPGAVGLRAGRRPLVGADPARRADDRRGVPVRRAQQPAPQSWLLAVTPDGEPWSLELVLDTLLETLEWATLRAVGPEDLLDYGRAIPTVFVPGDIVELAAGGAIDDGDGWDRLESMARSVELDGGLEARIADPLWMLARQWQVGEFRGDDAAQPAAVRLSGRSAAARHVPRRAAPVPRRVPFPTAGRWRRSSRRRRSPSFGAAGLHAVGPRRPPARPAAARARRSARPWRRCGRVPARRADRRGVEVGEAGRATAARCSRAGVSTAPARAGASPTASRAALASSADRPARAPWRSSPSGATWYRRRGGPAEERDLGRRAARVHVHARRRAARAARSCCAAPEHAGGHLDWYAFDVATEPAPATG